MIHRRAERAFTLVELLACLAVVAIVLPVAMGAISVATRTSGLARQQLEAANLAQSKLNELVVTSAWQGSELAGDFGADWPDYRWSAQVAEYDASTLQQLTLRVTWTTRGKDQSVALTTLVRTGGT